MRIRNHRNTRKKRVFQNQGFLSNITCRLMEMLMTVKMFHWNTTVYAIHKATDELYASLNGHVDQFVEVLLGKRSGSRIPVTSRSILSLPTITSLHVIKREVEGYKSFIIGLPLNGREDTDLANIRDAILGDLNRFLYLLSFS